MTLSAVGGLATSGCQFNDCQEETDVYIGGGTYLAHANVCPDGPRFTQYFDDSGNLVVTYDPRGCGMWIFPDGHVIEDPCTV